MSPNSKFQQDEEHFSHRAQSMHLRPKEINAMQYKIKAMHAKCYHNASMMLVKCNTNANKQYYNAGTVIGQC